MTADFTLIGRVVGVFSEDAMKSCPTCTRNVANNSAACPHCGHRFRSAVGFILQWIVAIIVIVLAIGIFLHFAG